MDWPMRQKRHALKWYLGISPIPPRQLRQTPQLYMVLRNRLAGLNGLAEDRLTETQSKDLQETVQWFENQISTEGA